METACFLFQALPVRQAILGAGCGIGKAGGVIVFPGLGDACGAGAVLFPVVVAVGDVPGKNETDGGLASGWYGRSHGQDAMIAGARRRVGALLYGAGLGKILPVDAAVIPAAAIPVLAAVLSAQWQRQSRHAVIWAGRR